jgi:hypothetical protein
MRIVLLFTLLVFSLSVSAQQQWVVKKDLQQEWLISDSTTYSKFTEEVSVTTVYVNLPVKQFRTDYFKCESSHPVSVLLNNVLIADRVTTAAFSIDSLAKRYDATSLFISIHSEQHISTDNLATQIVSGVLHQTRSTEDIYAKASTTFRDFVITAVLALIIFLVSIIRLNPGLSSDYFSIRKIFFRRESEDDHYYYRVTSSTILFYVFTSLLLALYLMIVSRFTNASLGIIGLTEASYGLLIFTWLKISVYILLFLFIKITIIYLISLLFGIREIAGYHFFNFVRILLVTIGLFSIVLLIYFVLHGQRQSFYDFLYSAIPWILGAWILLGFLKLASRVQHSAFHLFSYICATELIPFFIILEVLNK